MSYKRRHREVSGMLCKRIIGTILIEKGFVVRRVGFKTQSIIGRPAVTISYLNKWDVDEIAFINVGEPCNMLPILEFALKDCFLPVSVGGNISSFDEAKQLILNGADKVIIGRYATKELCESISDIFGAQAVVVSIDSNHEETLNEVNTWNIGEVILHDKKRDGKGEGLNLDILKLDTKFPKIAMGGVGNYEHICEGLALSDGVAVGNLFHFKEVAAKEAKKLAKENGLQIRELRGN